MGMCGVSKITFTHQCLQVPEPKCGGQLLCVCVCWQLSYQKLMVDEFLAGISKRCVSATRIGGSANLNWRLKNSRHSPATTSEKGEYLCVDQAEQPTTSMTGESTYRSGITYRMQAAVLTFHNHS